MCNQGRAEQFSLILLWILAEVYVLSVKRKFIETKDLEQALCFPCQPEKAGFGRVVIWLLGERQVLIMLR